MRYIIVIAWIGTVSAAVAQNIDRMPPFTNGTISGPITYDAITVPSGGPAYDPAILKRAYECGYQRAGICEAMKNYGHDCNNANALPECKDIEDAIR